MDQLLGTASIIGALVALIHAVRIALPDLVKTRKDAKERELVDATARAASDADIRARLDHCEKSHTERDARDATRDERDRKRDIEHARELGIMRGQMVALRDELSVLRSAPGPKSPEGKV